jgi:hypothetical protein
MRSPFDICKLLGSYNGLCNGCGEYDKWQPCSYLVPDHIPDSQVIKYLMVLRLKEIEIE